MIALTNILPERYEVAPDHSSATAIVARWFGGLIRLGAGRTRSHECNLLRRCPGHRAGASFFSADYLSVADRRSFPVASV